MPPIGEADLARYQRIVELTAAKLPSEVGDQLRQAVTPEALGLLVLISSAWAASHLVGIGYVADAALLGWAAFTFGTETVEIAKRCVEFANLARVARSEREYERAANVLAQIVTTLGISLVAALLARMRLRAAGRKSLTSGVVARLRKAIDDPDDILGALQRQQAKNPEAAKLLASIEEQLRNFNGRPTLRKTRSEERWRRASDVFDEPGHPGGSGPVTEPLTGRKLTASDQGRYLGVSDSRDQNAVAHQWNRMNIVEEQAIPQGSIVLEGFAAPQKNIDGRYLSGGGKQIFHAGQLSGTGELLPLSATERKILSGHATRPDPKAPGGARRIPDA